MNWTGSRLPRYRRWPGLVLFSCVTGDPAIGTGQWGKHTRKRSSSSFSKPAYLFGNATDGLCLPPTAESFGAADLDLPPNSHPVRLHGRYIKYTIQNRGKLNRQLHS